MIGNIVKGHGNICALFLVETENASDIEAVD